MELWIVEMMMAQSRNAILSSNDACSLMSIRIGILFHCLVYLLANELHIFLLWNYTHLYNNGENLCHANRQDWWSENRLTLVFKL